VDIQAGVGLAVDLVQESRKSTARCWADSFADDLAVAMFSAANKSIVPCRT